MILRVARWTTGLAMVVVRAYGRIQHEGGNDQ
jgi:hypothetical protein